jgi:nucleolar protein 53
LDEEIAKEKVEQARLRDLRDKAREVRSLETKQMSRHKFKEPDRDFNLASELKGNIRNLKTEGDLLKDRFKSLQKRNVIETRVKQK